MTTMNTTTLSETVRKNARPEIADWLSAFVERHGAFVGSVHLAGLAGEDEIVLVAAHNLPAAVANGAAVVPLGKGLAGATAERQAAIGLTDLQTDTSGVARPAACVSDAKGSLTLPVFAPEDPARLLAVVGLGFEVPRQFTEEGMAAYGADATTVLDVA
ncbi:hypothetical protein OK074_6642 [Actinobacteria bacterium OK074]|nr:hypothetical protein OK074_6642 [Actinobacteria bacterium OK074]